MFFVIILLFWLIKNVVGIFLILNCVEIFLFLLRSIGYVIFIEFKNFLIVVLFF